MNAAYNTAAARKRGNVIDLTAVESQKARAQNITCMGAVILTLVLALACLACGAFLPQWVEAVSPVTVWISMGLEAGAFGLLATSRWINRNALG